MSLTLLKNDDRLTVVKVHRPDNQIDHVPTGVKAFAPTWDIVLGVKSGEITEADYTARYLQLMEESQQKYPQAWEKLLSFDVLAVSCFCSGTFCHRYLLVDIISELCRRRNLPFIYKGEVK